MISELRTYIQSCPLIDNLYEDMHIDFTDSAATSYGIMPTGENILKRFIAGGCKKQYNAVLYIRNYTIDDFERLQNSEFLENFSSWIEEQNETENFPIVENINIESVSCANGMLFDLDETGNTGLYQLQLQIIYTKE